MIKIIWNIVVNIVIFLVVIIIMASGRNGFETRVLAILIIILTTLSALYSTYGKIQLDSNLLIFKQFYNISKLLKDPKTNEMKDELEEALSERGKVNTVYYISVISGSIIWVVSLFFLLFAGD